MILMLGSVSKLTYPPGSDRGMAFEHEGCLPSPPLSPPTSSKQYKSSFSQRLSKVNTLLRGPFEASSSHKNKQKEHPAPKSQQSVDTVDTVETGSVLSPASSATITTASSSNSNGQSSKSPISTGETSRDSKVASPSSRETEQNKSGEKRPLNGGTVISRRKPGAHPRSSLETDLPPIHETTLDYANATILTVERAAAAKIYLETHFNNLLSPDPTPRSIRRQKLEIELHKHMHDENFTPEQQEQMHAGFCRRETEHLREYRVMKARSIRTRTAERGDRVAGVDDDYELLKILGKGSFGVVRLVRERSNANLRSDSPTHAATKQVYAMKVIRKSDMIRTSQEGHIRAERDFLVASKGSNWYEQSPPISGAISVH
jgi:hypothetical protein